jgi:hypothetical protein
MTKAQLRVLHDVYTVTKEQSYDACGLQGSDLVVGRNLERLGMLDCVGYGPVDCDEFDSDREYPLFRLSPLGFELARKDGDA